MRVAIFGAGGVGGYLGARMADAGTADVHLVARGSHLDALRKDGLRLRSGLGDVKVSIPATDDPGEIGPVDVVVFTVKATETEGAAEQLAPLLTEDTPVVSFQNGVDNEERIAKVIGTGHVLGGAAYIFSTIAEPGLIHHTGGPARFIFGEMDGRKTARATRFHSALRDAGVDAEISEDIEVLMWRKFVFICAQAGMSTAARLPAGDLREDPEAWRMYRAVVDEVCAVAVAEGIAIGDGTADQTMGFARDLDAGAYSSLHFDLNTVSRWNSRRSTGTLSRSRAATRYPFRPTKRSTPCYHRGRQGIR